jgi:hypothetical protein
MTLQFKENNEINIDIKNYIIVEKLINIKIIKYIFKYIKSKHKSNEYDIYGDFKNNYDFLHAELLGSKYVFKIIRRGEDAYFDMDTYFNILQDIEQNIMDNDCINDECKDLICCYINDKKNI